MVTKYLYTVEEASELCSMGKDHIYRYLKLKALRSVKSGSRRLIPASAIPEFVQWLEENQPGDDLED